LGHLSGLLPGAWLLHDWFGSNLGVNPIQETTLRTGKAALVFLTFSLAITPLQTVLGARNLYPLRKWFGLYAFLYALAHALIFTGLDYGFQLALIQRTVLEKPYILAGAGTFLMLLPLAITSTRGWQRRLGRSWKRVHRLVYPASLTAVLHYLWVVKSDVRAPLTYATVIGVMLGLRLPPIRRLVLRRRHLRPWRRAKSALPTFHEVRDRAAKVGEAARVAHQSKEIKSTGSPVHGDQG
jgi:sulfoxide reductase heme-binding subunit YedZ